MVALAHERNLAVNSCYLEITQEEPVAVACQSGC